MVAQREHLATTGGQKEDVPAGPVEPSPHAQRDAKWSRGHLNLFWPMADVVAKGGIGRLRVPC
eukprot:7177415-Prymnesium_polylepis.1